jgi:alpha-glucosidase
VADDFPHRLLIGETYLKFPELVVYYGTPGAPEVHLPYNFNLLKSPWEVSKIRALIHDYEAALPSFGWPNWVLGNHDRPRLATRVGVAQARVAAMLLLTLRGTPTIYQGEELGLENVPIPPELVQDTFEKNEPGRGNGRDPERTPMPWDASALGAFTTGKPWLPLGEENLARNVKAEERESHSMLALYRRLLALRAKEPALSVGHYVPIATPDPVLVYERRHDRDRFVVALNFSAEPRMVKASPLVGKVALSTTLGRENEKVAGKLRLGANEGVLIRCPPAKHAH